MMMLARMMTMIPLAPQERAGAARSLSAFATVQRHISDSWYSNHQLLR
jgi:hypothetical protein